MGQSGRSTLRARPGNIEVRRKARGASERDRDDVKKQIDSDLNDRKRIYQLVNVKTGGGQLVEIIKNRARVQSSLHSSGSFGNGSQTHYGGTGAASKPSALRNLDQQVDEQIRKLVEPLLYNRGRGKLVPLAEIWQHRFDGSGNTEQTLHSDSGREVPEARVSNETGDSNHGLPADAQTAPPFRTNAIGSRFRWVCWRLDERGFVGETALHICFLLSTPTHMILAKKLLRLFPALINDIYTCDEYFGESSLHMGIVNEDVRIVKLLLDHGANVHERCLGSFFLPEDQKTKANGQVFRKLLQKAQRKTRIASVLTKNERGERAEAEGLRGEEEMRKSDDELEQDIDLQSNYFSDPQTNYNGYTYWGEYPLSFAASLGLSDCYKLLLAKGANPNRQDSNGNSTLHICVIANRIEMFDLCYSNGANLNLLNSLGFSPLSLAAKLCRVNMFFHILTIMRQINWIFCNVGFVDIPLDGIDSISTRDGSHDDRSVLSIVVSGNSNEHLQMLDGLLNDLLQVKWETSVRSKFRGWLAQYFVFLIISTFAYVTRLDIETASAWISKFNQTSQASYLSNSTSSFNANERIVYKVARDYKLANQYSEFALVCCVCYYLSILAKRCLIESTATKSSPATNGRLTRKPKTNARPVDILSQAPELAIFTLNCLLILLCIPTRFLFNWKEGENFLAATIMFLLPMKLLFFCRGSKSLGSFIVMIYKILVNDVLCFVVFLIIFIAGFGQSFILIFKTYRPTTNNGLVVATRLSEQDSNGSLATTLSKSLVASAQTSSTLSPGMAQSNFFESLVDENGSYFLNFYDNFITLQMMALNEFSLVVDEFRSTDYPNLARVLFCVYMILVSILLVNMLIAMLGKTYQDIASQPNENLRQWARALLTVEQMCSPKTRLQMLNKYSIKDQFLKEKEATTGEGVQNGADSPPCINGGRRRRYYSSTWALTSKDLVEINSIKQLNREHEVNFARLAARESLFNTMKNFRL